MYTVDCKDPDCIKCKLDPKGHCAGKGIQCQIPEEKEQSSEVMNEKKLRTLENIMAKDIHSFANDREECLSTFRKLKEEVHRKINELINVLREKELALCLEIDEECCVRMQRIDHVAMNSCINKISTCKGNPSPLSTPPLPTPVFNCNAFDIIKDGLKSFGILSFKYPDGTEIKKQKQEPEEARPPIPPKQPLPTPISLKEDFKMKPNDELSLDEEKRMVYMQLAKLSQSMKDYMKNYSKGNCFSKDSSKRCKEEQLSRDLEKDKKGKIDVAQKSAEELQCPKALKLKVICENSKNLLIADEVTGRTCIVNRPYLNKNYQDNPSNETELPLPQASKTNECSPVIKHLESLAGKITEERRKRIMAISGSGIRDSVSDKEKRKENSVENELPKPEVKMSFLPKHKKVSPSSESTDSLMSEEIDNDSSLDEDDIEIITKSETDSIPFELTFTPPLPMKSRFKIGAKPSGLCPSLFRKKGNKKPSHPSESGVTSKCSDISVKESEEVSQSSLSSSSSDTELKKNPWIKKEPTQESSSDSLKDVGLDNDPTTALRSSFKRYLEKNLESEWLAIAKIPEQSKSDNKSSIKNPILDDPSRLKDINKWLFYETTKREF